MSPECPSVGCRQATHFNRRTLLRAAGLSGISWLTPLAHLLARAEERAPRGDRPRSVIVLWLQGGPSQLETFDPHPGTSIAAGSEAIRTAVQGIQLASGFEQLAGLMDSLSLVRSLVSEEGDHERATYYVKTGYRPDPTLVHPSLGAVVCHQLSDQLEIPRHVSVLHSPWPPRGGYLGDQFDAFQIGDPLNPIPDVGSRVSPQRMDDRLKDLEVVEGEFARGRLKDLDRRKTLHRGAMQAAVDMMSSEQLKAFDVSQAPASLRMEYGDTPFGRGCLAAVRLMAAGVRCVEVNLGGWDSHLNNHVAQANQVAILDPALSALIRDLQRRELWEQTVVLCGGEFGRTPRLNPAGGRDHWPHGFSVAIGGGGIRGGRVVGETSPEPDLQAADPKKNVTNAKGVADIHATILHALGIDFTQDLETPIGRMLPISKGTVIQELLA